jgi:hypothetical protein
LNKLNGNYYNKTTSENSASSISEELFFLNLFHPRVLYQGIRKKGFLIIVKAILVFFLFFQFGPKKNFVEDHIKTIPAKFLPHA